MTAVPTDEIYERYLQKAIAEINELGDEIGRAGDEQHVPVLGSGHPLADVFLLKYEPKPSEIQEGVAFYGRAGQALLKSLQRLRVDPMAVFGTNCLKLAGQDPEEAKPWLTRELHIVQPKLLVAMGEQTVAFLNAVGVPAFGSDRPGRRGPAALHRHDSGARRPGHRRRPRRGAREDRLLERLQSGGRVVRRAAAVLRRPRALAFTALTAAFAAYSAGAGRLWDAGLWPDLLFLTLVVFPATLGLIWLALPLRRWRGLLFAGLGLVVLAVLLRLAELDVLFNLAKLFALTALGFWFLSYFESVLWAALVALIIPWVDAVSVWRGPTDYVVSEQPNVFENLSIAFRVPGETGSANLGPPDILFFALFLATADRWRLRVAWTWVSMTALLGATLILTATTDVDGLPALPAICVGFLLPNVDLLWREFRRSGKA